jgi:hypothetical protein
MNHHTGPQQAFLSAGLSVDRNFISPARVGTFPIMNGGVSKPWTCRSRVKLSKALQETLLDAVASNAGVNVDAPRLLGRLADFLRAELPQNLREQSRESRELGGDATPVQTLKRRLDATTESDPLPMKRARLTRTDIQQPGVEDEKSEQADKV